MPKKQTEEKPTNEVEPPAASDMPKLEPPSKQGEPAAARGKRKIPPAEAGAPERARASGDMQSAMGNLRTGQMMPPPEEMEQPARLGGGKDDPKAPPITTPLPKEAVRTKSGAAQLQQGGIKVTVLPDAQSKKKLIVNGKETDAFTDADLKWSTPKNYDFEGGKITSFDPAPDPTLTIQTTYGPGASSGDKSAYGRGTTAEDIKAGRTTLGHHEGSHGLDYLQYIKDHPLPQFQGSAGMSIADYRQAEKAYHQAMSAYKQAMMEYSKKRTDCTGTPGEGCDE